MKHRFLAIFVSLCIITLVPASNVRASATSRKLYINVYLGTSNSAVYGFPDIVQAYYSGRVYSYFMALCGISVEFERKGIISSEVDQCLTSAGQGYDSFCTCANKSACNTSHHTNATIMANSVFPLPRPYSSAYDMFITATRICKYDSSGHGSIKGICYKSNNKRYMIVRDSDYTKDYYSDPDTSIYFICATMVHEIGHLYNVVDHYNTYYGDERDNCI